VPGCSRRGEQPVCGEGAEDFPGDYAEFDAQPAHLEGRVVDDQLRAGEDIEQLLRHWSCPQIKDFEMTAQVRQGGEPDVAGMRGQRPCLAALPVRVSLDVEGQWGGFPSRCTLREAIFTPFLPLIRGENSSFMGENACFGGQNGSFAIAAIDIYSLTRIRS
jgi:hypothetical protein